MYILPKDLLSNLSRNPKYQTFHHDHDPSLYQFSRNLLHERIANANKGESRSHFGTYLSPRANLEELSLLNRLPISILLLFFPSQASTVCQITPLHSLSFLCIVFSSDYLPHCMFSVDFYRFTTYLLYPHACFYLSSLVFVSHLRLSLRHAAFQLTGTLHHHHPLLLFKTTEPEKLNIHKTKTCTLHT